MMDVSYPQEGSPEKALMQFCRNYISYQNVELLLLYNCDI